MAENDWQDLFAEDYMVLQAGDDFAELVRTWLEEAPDAWDAGRPQRLPQGHARSDVRIVVQWRPHPAA